jgi:prepilin-type N-terminal cleavage/methylation domain-containing protein
VNKRNKGMTLLEVLFATAIFSFVSIALFALFKLGQSYWGKGMSYNAIQNDMKRTSILLENILRQSSSKAIKCYDYSLAANSSIKRDVIVVPYYKLDDKGNDRLAYACFIATKDREKIDDSGYLYFVEFLTPVLFSDSDKSIYTNYNFYFYLNGSTISATNWLYKNDINSVNIKTADGKDIRTLSKNNLSTRVSTFLLSDNILSFDVRVQQNSGVVKVDISFVKRAIGYNTNQVIQNRIYISPMNTTSGSF